MSKSSLAFLVILALCIHANTQILTPIDPIFDPNDAGIITPVILLQERLTPTEKIEVYDVPNCQLNARQKCVLCEDGYDKVDGVCIEEGSTSANTNTTGTGTSTNSTVAENNETQTEQTEQETTLDPNCKQWVGSQCVQCKPRHYFNREDGLCTLWTGSLTTNP